MLAQAVERSRARDRHLERHPRAPRQLEEPGELEVFAAVTDIVDHRRRDVGLPRHDRREALGPGIVVEGPAFQDDRLARRDPAQPAGGYEAIGLTHVFGEGEEAVVLMDQIHREQIVARSISAFLREQLGLSVARVGVQVGGALGAAVFVAEPAGS